MFYPHVLYEHGGKGRTMAYSAYANRSVIGLPPTGSSGVLVALQQHGCLAHSMDGVSVRVSWTKCASNPVLVPSPSPSPSPGSIYPYDSIFATSPSVVTVNAKGGPLIEPLLYIYYILRRAHQLPEGRRESSSTSTTRWLTPLLATAAAIPQQIRARLC